MRLPRLMVITDRHLAGDPLLPRLRRCLERATPGSVVVQLRDRDAPIGWRLALGQVLRGLTRETEQELSVGDRLDLALLLGADALHLPEGGVDTERARSLGKLWVSRAWHSGTVESAPDAWVVSPAMAPRKGRPALGVTGLRAACEALQRPVYALGGVEAGNARQCLEAGAHGVAVIGAALDGRDVSPLLDALQIRRH